MKLRFHQNALRLRLDRIDATQLARTGYIEETVTFAPGQVLSYRLESVAAPDLTASFNGSRITVRVPRDRVSGWVESDQTGIEGRSGSLNILIEKDFQCMHRDSDENAAAFPNPAAQAS